jgi:hypothetical protein
MKLHLNHGLGAEFRSMHEHILGDEMEDLGLWRRNFRCNSWASPGDEVVELESVSNFWLWAPN